MTRKRILNMGLIALFFVLVATAAFLIALTLRNNSVDIALLKNELIRKETEELLTRSELWKQIAELQAEVANLSGNSAAVAKSVKAIEDRPQVKPKSQDEVITSALDNVAPAVVSIIKKRDEVESGAGTGFFVTKDGYLLTNRHVISDANATYLILLDNGDKIPVYIIFQDEESDIAILNVEGGGYKIAKLGNSSTIRIGQSVIAIGNALGKFENSASVGVISGLNRTIDAEARDGSLVTLKDVIQTDAAINRGNSGGPLIDTDGNVIGINVATAVGSNSISFSIPINRVKTVLKESPLKLSL
ncbi:MAG TPA: trypsin-like peptidase domain-containing protein [Candidatus Paceibacterota bacterium]